MVNKSKAKGTAAETRVVNFLLAHGYDAKRVVLHGSADHGDVHIDSHDKSYRICLEVKGGKQTQSVSRKQRDIWLTETDMEGLNSGRDAYLVIAKHGSSVQDYHVWDRTGHKFWYLNEFVMDPVIRVAQTEVVS